MRAGGTVVVPSSLSLTVAMITSTRLSPVVTIIRGRLEPDIKMCRQHPSRVKLSSLSRPLNESQETSSRWKYGYPFREFRNSSDTKPVTKTWHMAWPLGAIRWFDRFSQARKGLVIPPIISLRTTDDCASGTTHDVAAPEWRDYREIWLRRPVALRGTRCNRADRSSNQIAHRKFGAFSGQASKLGHTTSEGRPKL